MEQTVKVRRILDNGMAQVVLVRQSACSGDCHKCSGCGAAQEMLMFEADNPLEAKPGDTVIVKTDTGPVLYMLPLVLFFLGYALGALWNLGTLVGCLAFVRSIALIVVYDRKVLSKNQTVYTITGYAGK